MALSPKFIAQVCVHWRCRGRDGPLGGHDWFSAWRSAPGNGTNPARSRCRLARRSGRRRGPRMLSIPVALDALNFLSADVRNLFGPFINVFLVTSQHWTQTDVGLITTGSGLLGIALQTPIGAAIDVTHAKRAVIVGTMAAMTLCAIVIYAVPTFWPMALATSVLALAGDAFVPAVAALTLGLVTRAALARRLGRNSAYNHAGNIAIALVAGGVGISLHPARGLPARAPVRGADRRRRPDDSGGRHRSRPGARPRQGRRRRRGPGLRDPLPHPAADDLRRMRALLPLRQCAAPAAGRTEARAAIPAGKPRR